MSIRYILILLIIFAVSCKSNPDDPLSVDIVNNPVSANGNGKGNAPVMEPLEKEYNFGKINQGDKVTHDFSFKNSGKSDLVITSASGSCGCTVPEYSKEPVAPGKEGKIHVVFNSEGKQGQMDKQITVLSNSIPNIVVFHLRGEVIIKETKK